MQAHPNFSSKLPLAGTTIFTVISAAANEHGAINLGQGFPDYPMDERLTNLVNEAMQNGHNQYTHSFGYPPLREAIAAYLLHQYHYPANADSNITVTAGGCYALYTAITALLGQNDEAIYFEPAYDCYHPQIVLAGAKPIPLPLHPETFAINWQAVNAQINQRTKAIIINTPHNPTGTTLSMNDLAMLEEIVARNPQLTIVSDEVYEHLVFNGAKHCSVLQSPTLRNRSVACYSFGKTYNCTGWKLGYAVAPSWLTSEFRKVHQFNAFSCFTPTQVALSEFINDEANYKSLGADLEQRQQHWQNALAALPFEPLPVYGSYFQLYKYDGISNLNEYDFCIKMIKEAGVAAIPVSSFYQQPTENKLIRFCFAKKEDTLYQAAERLRKWLN